MQNNIMLVFSNVFSLVETDSCSASSLIYNNLNTSCLSVDQNTLNKTLLDLVWSGLWWERNLTSVSPKYKVYSWMRFTYWDVHQWN